MNAKPAFRIVHAAENIKGGVGTYLRDLVRVQRASYGEDSVLAVVPRSQSDVLNSPPGVEVVTFDDRGARWRSTLRLAARVRAVTARVAPSVVHLHSTFAGLALRPLLRWAPAALDCRPVVVYCAHGWSFDRETSWASRRVAITLERALAPACDAIVCISGHEMRLARQVGISARRLIHIPNGIPLRMPTVAETVHRPEWPCDKRRLLFVGRFDRQKGIDILMAALHALRDSTFACLVGSAVLRDGSLLELPDNVRMTGWLSESELATYYESADVLVAPSRWEGFGLTAVEAMRARLPVIASRVGGLAEVVDDGVTGLLVRPDSSAALIEAIRSVSTESLREMGEAGRRRFVECFTLERMHAQLTALYQRLCAQNEIERKGRPLPVHPRPERSRHA